MCGPVCRTKATYRICSKFAMNISTHDDGRNSIPKDSGDLKKDIKFVVFQKRVMSKENISKSLLQVVGDISSTKPVSNYSLQGLRVDLYFSLNHSFNYVLPSVSLKIYKNYFSVAHGLFSLADKAVLRSQPFCRERPQKWVD